MFSHVLRQNGTFEPLTTPDRVPGKTGKPYRQAYDIFLEILWRKTFQCHVISCCGASVQEHQIS